jgi:hypothetical protein
MVSGKIHTLLSIFALAAGIEGIGFGYKLYEQAEQDRHPTQFQPNQPSTLLGGLGLTMMAAMGALALSCRFKNKDIAQYKLTQDAQSDSLSARTAELTNTNDHLATLATLAKHGDLQERHINALSEHIIFLQKRAAEDQGRIRYLENQFQPPTLHKKPSLPN